MSDVRIRFNPRWEEQVATKKVFEHLGPRIANMAQRLAPFDTGELHDSIGWFADKRYLYIFAAAPHSLFVEVGTYKMRAQPYLRPAAFRRWL